MSKHIFEQTVGETRYQVQIGWDRPPQRYYFVILPVNTESGREYVDEPVVSNLYLPNPDALTLDQIKAVCEDLGIVVPDRLLSNVMLDKHNDVANQVRFY